MLFSSSITPSSSAFQEVSISVNIYLQCVLTCITLALGALTQLVWARGTIDIILLQTIQALRISTALGLPLERPKCKFRTNERPVKTPRY